MWGGNSSTGSRLHRYYEDDEEDGDEEEEESISEYTDSETFAPAGPGSGASASRDGKTMT